MSHATEIINRRIASLKTDLAKWRDTASHAAIRIPALQQAIAELEGAAAEMAGEIANVDKDSQSDGLKPGSVSSLVLEDIRWHPAGITGKQVAEIVLPQLPGKKSNNLISTTLYNLREKSQKIRRDEDTSKYFIANGRD